MTKNNLTLHLSWLVGSIGFAPPSTGLDGPWLETTIASSSGSEDPLHGDPNLRVAFAPAKERQRRCVGSTKSTPDILHPPFQGETPSSNAPTTMARLQSASKSNKKPSVLTLAPSAQLQTPNTYQSEPRSTSLKDQYTAPYQRGTG